MITKERFNEFLRSRLFMGIVAGIGITLVAIFLFEAGVAVGYREASFSSQWGKNYESNFGMMTSRGGIMLTNSRIPNPEGTLGKIVSITPAAITSGTTTIVVAGPQNPEENVLITSDTMIRDNEDTLTVSALKVGSYAVVLGEPDSKGQINAKLIRIVPAMPMMTR